MKPTVITAGVLALALSAAAQEPAELTEHHEHLKQMVGTWTVKTKFMTGPDGAAEESTGEEKVKLGKGGYWTLSDFKGEMTGVKFNGAGIMTYDVKKKKYVNTWVDSISSALTVYEGTCDKDGKVFTLTGQTEEPDLGAKVTMKLTYTVKDENSRTLVIAMLGPEGNDIPLGTIDYTRAEKGKKKKKPAEEK